MKENENENLKKEFDEQKVDLELKNAKLNEQCESLKTDIQLKEDVVESLKGKIKSSNDVLTKFKEEVENYQKMSGERRREMYEVNLSLQETLAQKEAAIAELKNKIVNLNASDIEINKSDEYKFVCDNCSYEVKQKYELKIHMKMEHGINPNIANH